MGEAANTDPPFGFTAWAGVPSRIVVASTHWLKIPRWDRLRPRSRYSWDEPPAHPIEAMMSIPVLQQTAAATLVPRDITAQRAAAAAENVVRRRRALQRCCSRSHRAWV